MSIERLRFDLRVRIQTAVGALVWSSLVERTPTQRASAAHAGCLQNVCSPARKDEETYASRNVVGGRASRRCNPSRNEAHGREDDGTRNYPAKHSPAIRHARNLTVLGRSLAFRVGDRDG
jgi:hypothetical protein